MTDLLQGPSTPSLLSKLADLPSRPESLTNTLDMVLDEVERDLDPTWAAVWLFDADKEEWYIALSRGLSSPAAQIRFARGSALPCRVGEQGSPVLIDNLAAEVFFRTCPEHHAMRSAVYAPMRIGSEPVGVMAVYSDRRSAFTKEDLSYLIAVGNHLRIALALAAMEERRELKAILDERDRLAEDLHDGMLQILASMRLLLSEARDNHNKPDRAVTAGFLAELEATLDAAIEELRGAVAGLRGAKPFQDVVVSARRAKRRLESAGVETELALESLELPRSLSDVLASVCRESVNNILRHSGAKHARISLSRERFGVEMLILDDGVGLPGGPPEDRESCFGLQIMAERVRRVGGTLRFENSEDGGMRVICRTPTLEAR